MTGRLVLVRHGQSHGNVEKRLDTRPPGAELTPLGREQARAFAHASARPALLVHSIATRARQTAAEIGAALKLGTRELEGLHEVQVGDLENRNDDAAVDEFNRIYRRWHEGELDVPLPGGETATDVLDRYLPVMTDLRVRYLDNHDWPGDIVVVSHGAAIRLVAKTLAGVESSFRSNIIWETPGRSCSLRSQTAGGAVCTGGRQRRRSTLRTRARPPHRRIRWADRSHSRPRRSR
jgi:probable phosphoglycerate mutase